MSVDWQKKVNFYELVLMEMVNKPVADLPHNQKDNMVEKTKAFVQECMDATEHKEYALSTNYEMYRTLIK